MQALAVGWLALASALSPAGAAAAEAAVTPFVAEYDVRYGRLPGGTSRTVLATSGAGWVLETAANATGLARIVAPGTVRQRAEFDLAGDVPRPLHYTLDDGTKRTDRDVRLEFDWPAGRVRAAPRARRKAPRTSGRKACASSLPCTTPKPSAGACQLIVSRLEPSRVVRYTSVSNSPSAVASFSRRSSV